VISDDFVGPVAVAMSYGDVIAPAKIIIDFTKDLETIKVKSGMMQGRKLSAADVKALAKMPPLNELRARLLGMIKQPSAKLVRTIAEPGSRLARIIQARAEQK